MGPKAKGPTKKTQEKAKQKIVQDKTFGLKNKNKSKTVQKYIKSVEAQVHNQKGGQSKKAGDEFAQKEAKKKAAADQALLASLFKTVGGMKKQEVAEGEDTKKILCQYFKAGTCAKGNKCKFSHDMSLEAKSAKMDIYTDPREASWTEEEKEKRTDITCKHFLEAVEQKRYGWFWKCADGDDCRYRHAVPPGYIIKADKKKQDAIEEEDELTLEEKIEEQRRNLKGEGTKVTLESFTKWKKKKKQEEKKKLEDQIKKEKKKTGGKFHHILSGKNLFTYDPTLFQDDDGDEGDVFDMVEEGSGDEEEEKEPEPVAKEWKAVEESDSDDDDGEETKEESKGNQEEKKEAPKIQKKKKEENVAIDENVFLNEDAGDLDDLDFDDD